VRGISKSASVTLCIALGLAAGASMTVPSCRGATQVTLIIDTDLDCAVVRDRGVTVAVGDDPAEAETRASSFTAAETRDCTPLPQGGSRIGTLVLTPSASRRAAIVVVGGVIRQAAQCDAGNDYLGCIVARRQIAFLDHTSLELPVFLAVRCLDIACNPLSTCEQGACRQAEVRCSAGSCLPREEIIDAGQPDREATPEPLPVCGSANTPVSCGTGPRCTTPNVCCQFLFGADGGYGYGPAPFIGCDDPARCPYTRVACRDRSSCAPGDLCCDMFPSASTCGSSCPGNVLCRQDCDCPERMRCGGPAPGDFATCVPI
jgi:hypothetical protein